MARSPITVGPFSGGLNLFDDPTAVADNELVESINWDAGLDGSLQSRPPIGDLGLRADTMWGMTYLGSAAGWHIFTERFVIETPVEQDGGRTLAWDGGSVWRVISNSLRADAMLYFNDVIWLATTTAFDGGYWNPGGSFTAVSNMPKGNTLTEYKGRLFLGGNPTNPRRIYYSKTFAESDIWGVVNYITVSGEGGPVKQLATYYNSILIFRQRRIDTFSYSTTVSQGAIQLLVPDVGISSDYVAYEGSIYFRDDEKAYQFINNGVEQLNRKVPFVTDSGLSDGDGRVSRLGNRIVFYYTGSMYVYNTLTRTWSTWYTDRGNLQPFADHGDGRYYAMESSYFVPAPGPGGAGLYPEPLRTNYAWNGNARETTNGWNTLITSPGAGTLSRVNSSATLEGAPVGSVIRLVCTTAAPTNFYVRFGFDTNTWMMPNGNPGEQVRASAWIYQQSSNPKAMRIVAQWFDFAGNAVGSAEFSELTVTPATYTRITMLTTIPVGGIYLAVRMGMPNGVAVGDFIQATGLTVEDGATDYMRWFDGQRPPDTDAIYLARGSVSLNAQVPRAYPNLRAKLLPFADRFSAFSSPLAEDFTCEILTKNYDLQLAANFKRLFWWGVDAVVDKRFRGWALPVNGDPIETENSPRLEERRNLALNPVGLSGGDTTDWTTRTTGWTRTFPGIGARFTCTSSQTSDGRGFDIRGNARAATPGTDATWRSIPVTAGEPITASVWIGSNRPINMKLEARIHDGSGAWLGTAVIGNSGAPGSRLSVTITPPANGYLVISAVAESGVTFAISDWYEGFQLLIEKSSYAGNFFDGNTSYPAVPDLVCRWLGTPGASVSVEERIIWDVDTTRRFIKMLMSLRFRQLAFRLIFDADGTAPIKLFSLTAFVGTKETVPARAN